MSDRDNRADVTEAQPSDRDETDVPRIEECDVPIGDLHVPFGEVTRADVEAAKEKS